MAVLGFMAIITCIYFIADGRFRRSYHLICENSDGSQFKLEAKYWYYPFALGHEVQRLMDGDWEIHYLGVEKRKARIAPAGIHFSDAKMADCSRVGKLDGYPFVRLAYLKEDGEWSSIKIPKKLYLSPVPAEQPDDVRTALERVNASPRWNFAIVLPKKNRLIYEMPLNSFRDTPGDGQVVAVYKSISLDNGATWQDAVVTTEAEIYELGKSEKAQSFAAKAKKIDEGSRDANPYEGSRDQSK